MKLKNFVIAIILFFSAVFLSGCSPVESPQVTANSENFSGGDEIVLAWNEIKNAESYKVSFYTYPFSDNKLARSIELAQNTWKGVMPAGKYDVVVCAVKRSSLSENSNVITINVESQSVPNWDDINYIFNSINNQVESRYGITSVVTDTGPSVVKSYQDPLLDLTYPDNKPSECSQIDIYDTRFILFGLRISVNTQAELISALNKNAIAYQNSAAGSAKATSFTYKDYKFTVYIDSKNKLSMVSVQK